MATLVASCRAAAPSTGTPPQAHRIVSAPLPAESATFTSTNADLAPMASFLGTSTAFGGDVLSGLGWGFEGATEDFNPLGAAATHTRGTHSLGVPVDIGTLPVFAAELAALNTDPTVAAILGGAAIPALPLGGLPLDQLVFRVNLGGMRMGWRPAGPGVPNATLRMQASVSIQPDPSEVIDALLDIGPYTTPLEIDITATPCGTCTGVRCDDPVGRVSAGYRSGIATGLGYAPGDVDAVYPDQGLNFAVAVTGGDGRTVGSTSYTPVCPFTVADLAPELLRVIASAHPGLFQLVEIIRSGVPGPFSYILGFAACTILANEISGRLRDAVVLIPAQIQQPIDLLINPPTMSVRLGAAGGVPGVPVLPPGTVADGAIASIALVSVPSLGAPPVALTNPDGSYNDAFYTTIATGGTANVAGVTVNLVPVINACATGIGLGPTDAVVCGACNPGGLCVAPPAPCAFLCAPGGGFLPAVGLPGGGFPAITIAPAPRVANLLSGAPLVAETVRRWFASPLPPDARYVTSTPGGGTRGNATFSYIVDPDDDCVSSEGDLCPTVFDPAQIDDGDGDRWGAACDLCPGVPDSGADANLDRDGDGVPNGCDCDVDGDGCPNAGAMLTPAGAVPCAPSADGVFDPTPGFPRATDGDGDGIPDDCDIDWDNDGVPNDVDNCPVGDGDGVFDPAVDTNPDQTDSGGACDGDVCDPLCPAIRCIGTCTDTDGGGGGGGGGGGPWPDRAGLTVDALAGLTLCAGLSGGSGVCNLAAFLECEGAHYDACWLPDRFDSLVLTDLQGQIAIRLDAAALGLQGGLARNAVALPDLDGDGLDDFALAAPDADGCGNEQQCLGLRGEVVVVSSLRGTVLARLAGPSDGAKFGAGLAAQGSTLAVGAPFAAGGVGSVSIYRLSPGRIDPQQPGVQIELRGVVHGAAVGDELGAHLSPALGASTADPSFLAGAPGGGFGAGELVLLDAARGATDRFTGPVPGARMSRGLVVERPGRSFLLVGQLPDAFAGDGALAFFQAGRPPRVQRGASGERFGDALVRRDGAGEPQLAVGAPGAEGSIYLLDLRGRTLSTTQWYGGSLFGLGLASPGDLDGDGQHDLVAGFALDERGAELRSVAIFELSP